MHTRELRAPLQHGGIVYGVEFSRDGKWLATASADGKARIWDVETGKEVWKFGDGKSRVFQANFSPDGRTLAVHDENSDKIKLWNLRDGTLERSIRAPKLTLERIFFSPDAKLVVAAGFTVELSNPLTGESVATLKDASYPVTLSPDGRTMAAAGPNHSVLLWSID
jgi:WD40 repeat protein